MTTTKQFSSSEQAEEEFYAAFEQANIDMMMSVWSTQQNISCIHPGGPRLDGLERIRESWLDIFEHEQNIEFEIKHKNIILEQNIAIHHVIEAISVSGKLQSELITTNIYHQTAKGWHLILHHASPELHAEVSEEEDELGDIHTIH